VLELTIRGVCGHTILLPLTKPPQLVIDQLPLTTGALPVNVLCPRCMRATACSRDKFRLGYAQRTLPGQPRADQICVCMQYECGEQGCKSPVYIHAPMTVSRDLKREAYNFSSAILATGVICEGGHICTGGAHGGALRIMVAPGWEPQQLNDVASDVL
jgi:hypothetical protein